MWLRLIGYVLLAIVLAIPMHYFSSLIAVSLVSSIDPHVRANIGSSTLGVLIEYPFYTVIALLPFLVLRRWKPQWNKAVGFYACAVCVPLIFTIVANLFAYGFSSADRPLRFFGLELLLMLIEGLLVFIPAGLIIAANSQSQELRDA